MATQTCRGCQFFIQHYGLDEKKLFRLRCGHCTLARTKRRNPDDPACGNFAPGIPDTEAFASQEYLTKALLQRLFSLPLLPEIKDLSTPQGKKQS